MYGLTRRKGIKQAENIQRVDFSHLSSLKHILTHPNTAVSKGKKKKSPGDDSAG